VIEDRRARIVGVAAAEDPGDPRTVVSHPGLTYGVVVHDGSVRGASMIGVLEGVAAHYRELGYRRLRYKAIPPIYHSAPAQDDLNVLFRLGARSYRSDLAAAIDLANRGPVQQRRARSRRRAEAAGVRTEQDWKEIGAFWRILELNLVLDEPTAGLDVQAQQVFWDDMRAYRASGRTVLFSTHYLEEADKNADRIVVIQSGHTVADGTPQEVRIVGGARMVVRFRWVGQPHDDVGGLPGVTAVERDGTDVTLYTTDSDATVWSLYDFRHDMANLEVTGGGLREASCR
jgi:hypothetical protein